VRGGRIVAEGWHRRFGGAHAEVEALRRVRGATRGLTAYVSLEPCCHHGKTPPCTDALLASGVSRVVAAMRDPNPRVAGRGLARLRRAGVEVAAGVLEEQARRLNAPFVKWVTTRRPWVILKWAQSIDGKIATRTGETRWISDAVMRTHAHRVRARVDAIVVGVGTVLADDPLLTARDVPLRRVARRVVLDTHLRTPLGSRLVRTARTAPTWIVCGKGASKRRLAALRAKGVIVLPIRSDRHGVDLGSLMRALGDADCTNVLIEGGGRLLGRCVDAGIGDELHVYVAPLLIGGAGAPGALHADGPARLADAVRLADDTAIRRLGAGWLLEARLAR
jgi:diaminohydroxyphosphoribosylaminopyrimidine deaminase/5-amino-6-(5-phosphoribosylamino)uracil reductase